jgi:hypothetical protein
VFNTASIPIVSVEKGVVEHVHLIEECEEVAQVVALGELGWRSVGRRCGHGLS